MIVCGVDEKETYCPHCCSYSQSACGRYLCTGCFVAELLLVALSLRVDILYAPRNGESSMLTCMVNGVSGQLLSFTSTTLAGG